MWRNKKYEKLRVDFESLELFYILNQPKQLLKILQSITFMYIQLWEETCFENKFNGYNSVLLSSGYLLRFCL